MTAGGDDEDPFGTPQWPMRFPALPRTRRGYYFADAAVISALLVGGVVIAAMGSVAVGFYLLAMSVVLFASVSVRTASYKAGFWAGMSTQSATRSYVDQTGTWPPLPDPQPWLQAPDAYVPRPE